MKVTMMMATMVMALKVMVSWLCSLSLCLSLCSAVWSGPQNLQCAGFEAGSGEVWPGILNRHREGSPWRAERKSGKEGID
jgi:hypothetical protein